MNHLPLRTSHVALLVVALAAMAGCRSLPSDAPVQHTIIMRGEWGAADPVLAMKRHMPVQITIHHTGTYQQPDRRLADKLLALQRFSQETGELADGTSKIQWGDIPYHFYIAADGAIAEARHVFLAGDTNTPYDPSGHLLIVLEGNFEHEHVTASQMRSLEWLTAALARQWDIPASAISGHRDHTETACPGDDLYDRLPGLRQWVASFR